jgi:hypothetical protein
MKLKLLAFAILFSQYTFAQVYGSKKFSQDIALYKAKEFFIDNILGTTTVTEVIKFEIDPLAAALSGEVTTLSYRCADKNKEGILLGFFGDYWDTLGNVSQAYSFKDLPRQRAMDFFDKIDKTTEPLVKYLNEGVEINNVYFEFEDMKIIVYGTAPIKIRILWNRFDCEWDYATFDKTKKRYMKGGK